MTTYTVQSPDYPGSGPAYQATERKPGRGRRRIDIRTQAFEVAELCAAFGAREEVFQDDTLIWQSLNCRPATQEATVKMQISITIPTNSEGVFQVIDEQTLDTRLNEEQMGVETFYNGSWYTVRGIGLARFIVLETQAELGQQ